MRLFPQTRLEVAFVALAALSLAGCAGGAGGSGDVGDTLGNLFAFNSTKAPPVPEKVATGNVVCPYIDVSEGGAAQRVGGGDGASVRYQYSIGEVARECRVVGDQLVMKVGVEGKVLLGPAGAPGSYTVPVRIAVRKEEGQQILASKVYRVAAAVPPGQANAAFTVVSEEIAVPYLGEAANQDYQIFVGFDRAGGEERPARRRR